MLTYLIASVQDLMATAVVFALLLAFADVAWDHISKRIIVIGAGVGFVAAIVMAFMKQTTSLIDTGSWNMVIFVTAFIALVLTLVLFIKPLAKRLGTVGDRIKQVLLALFIGLRVFYKLPDMFLYPFSFNLSGNGLFSTDFVFRVIGIVLGVLLAILFAFAVYKSARTLSRRQTGIFALAPACVIAIVQMMTALQTMLARRIIGQNHTLFLIVKFFSNASDAFTYLILLIALVPIVIVLIKSLTFNEPYNNPAEHRKIRARWRNHRRWSSCAIVCAVLVLLVLTVVQSYNSRGPELSPSEDCEMRDGAMYISFDQVADGHLHRFTYETQSGVGVRFIIIKKPGSSAYGIGLDACDICGETGYYERDGQVVCKLCDVVMNINTIGFKGGCNPIPIEYTINDGYIIVPTDGLAEYEKTFSS